MRFSAYKTLCLATAYILIMKKLLLALILFSCFSLSLAQTAKITPGDNLVTEGIPQIPASLAEDVSRYTSGRAANILGWHPARSEMLIATHFCNTVQVHQVKFPGASRRQLTFFNDNVSEGVSYEPQKGDYFIFNKDTGGDQNYQIYRYDFTTGNVTLLTDGKSKNSPGVWSKSGNLMAYGSTRRNGNDVDLYLMNPTTPKSDRMLLELEGGGWEVADWSPDDRKILLVENISANESYLWLVDVARGEKSLLTPKNQAEKVFYGDGKFSQDGKGVYVTSDRASEFKRLAFIEIATQRFTPLTDKINWDVEDFEPSPAGHLLAFVVNENGVTKLHLLDTDTRKERPFNNLPTGYVFGIGWHKNGTELAFNLDSARSPQDIYSLDTKTGKVTRWTNSETGGINTENFVEPEQIRWKSFDDRVITGFLYRPPARFTGKRPVIIDIHGGPEAQFQPYYMGRYNYYLNELGIVLIFPNIRGSSGFGKTFLKLDNGLLREDAYKDIGALLEWIETRPELDANRVMVTGASYGGYMTLVAATRYANRIRCAVDIVGPSNLVTFLENTAGYRKDLRRVEYGDDRDPDIRTFLEGIAPINNVSKIVKPLFVIQGKNDPIVPLSESEQMVAAARKNGAPVWYLMANDEGHGFFKKSNSDFQFYATVLFIKEYLLN